MKRFVWGLMLWLSACEAGTEGELVEVEVAFRAVGQDGQAPANFRTSTGWEVTLAEARLAIDSVLVFEPGDGSLALSRLWLGRARAHGGWDPLAGKRVRLEYQGPFVIDLLHSESQFVGVVEAEAGEMGTASVVFANQLGSEPGQAFVRGTARRDGQEVPFEGRLLLEDEPLLRRAEGISAPGVLSQGGRLTLQIKPFLFFDEAHFERLDPQGDEPRLITRQQQVHTAMLFGARSSRTYGTVWEGN